MEIAIIATLIIPALIINRVIVQPILWFAAR
jgi:hypothetical protein